MKAKSLTMVFVLACFMVFCPYLVLGSFAVEKDIVTDAGAKSEVNTNQESVAHKIAKAAVDEAYGKLPLYFIKNDGQVDEKVKYYVKGSGHTTFFTDDGIYLNLIQAQKSAVKSEMLKLSFLNPDNKLQVLAEGLQKGRVNYFVGNDPEKWRTDVYTYNAVVYRDI